MSKATSGLREEFNKATSDFTETARPSSTKLPESALKVTGKLNRDKGLSDIAERLNISTKGKTKEQITKEVIEKIESKNKEAYNDKTAKR
ncbi:MAG: hypothetical protein JSV12_08675 [Candidatus Bathyarchaeota archaeon]|nr:MAG: hypothetical protein JSV12_08675 [Candidatus Bathyarchaeota archaeon]